MAERISNCCGGETAGNRSGGELAGTDAERAQRRGSAFPCWDWCMGGTADGRRAGIRFGFLLILLGLIWLGGALGRLPADSVWPLTVITVGLWLAVFGRLRWKRKS